MEPALPRARRATATELIQTLELWPLDWWAMNGTAVCEAAELLRLALVRLAAPAPQSSSARCQTVEAA